MANDFSSSIKTIAKTNELQDKVDRLIQDQKDPVKAKLGQTRISAAKSPSGSTDISSGATNGADGVVGTGSDGSPVTGPPAPPPITPPNSNTTKSTSDAAITSASNSNIDTKSSSTEAQGTDKTDASHTTNNNGGGSVFADQGLLGANNADWLEIQAALTAKGASADEIAEARRQFLRKELGIDEVGDVFRGLAGPKITDDVVKTSSDSLAPNLSNSKEIQRGLVGVDPNNHAVAMLIRTDGYQPTPSESDAAFYAGTGPWTDPSSPPYAPGYLDFQLGYYWRTDQNGEVVVAATPTVVGNLLLTVLDTYESANAPHVFLGVTQVNISIYTLQFSRKAPAPNFSLPCSRQLCVGGEAAGVCPTEAPRVTQYPVTGVGTIVYEGGKFTASQYDSQAPLKYKTTLTSTAQIYSLSTGETYQAEPTANGGYMLSQISGSNPPYIMIYGADGSLVNLVSPSLKIFYTPR